jgi:hypothetical protein
MMIKDDPKRLVFSCEVPSGDCTYRLRELVSKDFENRFGDATFSITIQRVKEKDGIRTYSGFAKERIQ